MQGARCADVRCEGAKCEDVSYEDVKSQLLFWKNPTHRRSRELGGEVTKYCSAWGLHRSKCSLRGIDMLHKPCEFVATHKRHGTHRLWV
jgi:hypothetical protein